MSTAAFCAVLLELPDVVRDSFITPTFAEEDCEEPIAMTLLGLGNSRDLELALRMAGSFPRYAPALPYLQVQEEAFASLPSCTTV